MALDVDVAAAEMMGYDDMVAAERFHDGIEHYEIGLLPPGHMSETDYCFVIHVGCDPDNDSAGTSGVETCGPDLGAAEDYYLSRKKELILSFSGRPTLGG